MSLSLTLKRFQTSFWRFHRWFWTKKCRVVWRGEGFNQSHPESVLISQFWANFLKQTNQSLCGKTNLMLDIFNYRRKPVLIKISYHLGFLSAFEQVFLYYLISIWFYLKSLHTFLGDCFTLSASDFLPRNFEAPPFELSFFEKHFHICVTWGKANLADIYLFIVNNRNTRKRCETCSKLTIKTPQLCHWRISGVFIVNFENIPYIFLVFLLLTSNM